MTTNKKAPYSVSLLYVLLVGFKLSINQEFSNSVADFPLNKIWQFPYINTFYCISVRKLQWKDWQWVMSNVMSPAALRIGKYVCGLRFFPISILLLYSEFLWKPRAGEECLQRYVCHSLRNHVLAGEECLQRYVCHSLRNHVLDDWFHFQSTPVWFSPNILLGPPFCPTQKTQSQCNLLLPWRSVASVCKLHSCVQQQAICWGFGSWFGSVAVQIKTRSWANSDTSFAGALWTIVDQKDFSCLC